jgi:hypothetical protein
MNKYDLWKLDSPEEAELCRYCDSARISYLEEELEEEIECGLCPQCAREEAYDSREK